jgi:hypothetical protein
MPFLKGIPMGEFEGQYLDDRYYKIGKGGKRRIWWWCLPRAFRF